MSMHESSFFSLPHYCHCVLSAPGGMRKAGRLLLRSIFGALASAILSFCSGGWADSV